MRFVRESSALLQHLNALPPYVILGAFLGIREYTLAVPTEIGVGHYEARFDRDLLALPDVVLLDADAAKVTATLRPMFEGMWQAVGYGSDPRTADAARTLNA